jgi:very-short-patch-repair endonuclease
MSKIIEFERSFASHPKAQFWSSKNDGKPEDYSLNSHKKFLFDCNKCGHEFENSLKMISGKNTWCQYCAHKKLCNYDYCQFCFNNSFASHPKSKYWHTSNNSNPRNLFKNDHDKYKFNCDKCHYILIIPLSNITTKNNWCSYCSNHRLCDDNNCQMCFNNSFASIERSKYLNDKSINPRTLFKNSGTKHRFNCDKCLNQFEMRLSHVTSSFAWCNLCNNKTEHKLYKELINYYNITRQFKINWCINKKTNKYYPYDFAIENLHIIIELDGLQHFKQVGKWKSPKITKINDIYKIKCANENGYSIIRILQNDVFYNKYNWLEELIENINKIINDEIIQNIYMCKNNEYENFCNIDNIEE